MTTRRRSPVRARRRPGRPREEATDQAITEAALATLSERGLAGMSMEHVASRAGVAKSTLYRRWPSKVELALHAVATVFESITLEDSGSLDTDLRAGINEAVRLLSDPAVGSAYAALLSESARDPEGVGRRVRESLSARLQALVARSVERSVARGEIGAQNVDVPLLTDVAFARFIRATQGLDDERS